MCVYIHSWHINCLYSKEKKNVSSGSAVETKSSILWVHLLNNFTTKTVFGFNYSIFGCLKFSIREQRNKIWMQGNVRSLLKCWSGQLGACGLISAGSSSERYRQIKCSEETVEWKSVTLLDTDGSELLAITKSFFAQQIFNDSLYINLRELCWHFCLLDSSGHEQIWSAARRLWIVHFTPSQYFMSDGWGGRNNFLMGQRIFTMFLTPYGEMRAISICSDIHQRSWQKDWMNSTEICFFYS